MTPKTYAASVLACTLLCSASALALTTNAPAASAAGTATDEAGQFVVAADETPEEKAERLKKLREQKAGHPPAAGHPAGGGRPPAANGTNAGTPAVKKPAATSVPTVNPQHRMEVKKHVTTPPPGNAAGTPPAGGAASRTIPNVAKPPAAAGKPPVINPAITAPAGKPPVVNPAITAPAGKPPAANTAITTPAGKPPVVNPAITAPAGKPPVINPAITAPAGKPPAANTAGTVPASKVLPAAGAAAAVGAAGAAGVAAATAGGPAKLDAIKASRTVTTTKTGATVIKEADQRTIVKQGDKIVIQHNEARRLQALAPNAQVQKQSNGNNVTIINRNNYQIYNVTDSSGHLLQRYKQDSTGQQTMLINNVTNITNNNYGGGGGPGGGGPEYREGHSDHFGRNLAIGLGVGAGIVAGAVLLHELTEVHEPHYDLLPPERYAVRYERASDDDIYETLTAPPIERLDRVYTLDEVRATYALRQHMRRIDLDDVEFDTGSWTVEPGQYRKLDRIARGMVRAIERNPSEVFMIEGYTDAVGAPEDNLSLSDRRAESVAEILTREFDVPPENIVTQGYGEQYLKIQTEGPERENRRVAVRRVTPLIAKDYN